MPAVGHSIELPRIQMMVRGNGGGGGGVESLLMRRDPPTPYRLVTVKSTAKPNATHQHAVW